MAHAAILSANGDPPTKKGRSDAERPFFMSLDEGRNYIAFAVFSATFEAASAALLAAFMALSAAFDAFSAAFEAALAAFSAGVPEQAARPSEAARTSERAIDLDMGKPL
jgi:hypothetical protein